MFRGRPEMREPRVHVRFMIPRRQFDALARAAARRGRDVSAISLMKDLIADGLERLEAERGRPTPPCNPFHQPCDSD